MCTGVLSSLLSGAGYGTESGNMTDGAVAGADGQFYMAINVAFFEDVARFKSRVDAVVRQNRTSRRAAGTDSLYAPGALEAEIEARNRRTGIPVNERTLPALVLEASRLGVGNELEP